MVLQKVEIKNIRSHKDFIFEPETTGITAISGENGAGKSTIVDAFAWSLFGIRLHGLRNKNYIREGVDPTKEEVSVKSYITVGNREYLIERKIIHPEGTTHCRVYSRPLGSSVDYVEDCGPSVSHSDDFIKNLLGCDEKGFLSSVFIQQKQVDQIVSSGPKERGMVIEKLIGVSSISNAHNLAKEKSKTLQQSAKIIQPGSLEEEKAKIDKQKEVVQQVMEAHHKKLKEKEEKEESFREFEEYYLNEQKRQNRVYEKKTELSIVENKISTLEEQLTSQLELYSNMTVDKVAINTNIDDLEKEIKSLTMEKISLNSKLNELSRWVKDYEKLRDKVKNEIPENISEIYKDLISKKENAEKEIQDLEVSFLHLKDKTKHNKEMLQAMREGKTNCPMCGSELSVTESSIKEKEEEIERDTKLAKENSSQINKNKKLLLSLGEEIISALASKETLEEILNKKNEYANNVTEIEKIKINIESNDRENGIISKRIDDAKISQFNKKNSESVKKMITTIKNQIKEEKNSLAIINKVIEEINAIPEKEFTQLTSRFNKLSKELKDIELEEIRLSSELHQSREKGKFLLQSYKNCKEAHIKFAELSKQIEIQNMSADSLNKFKSERVKKSIPKLTEIASEILNKFTSGDFVEFKLSSKFEASVVTRTGKERPVAQLSGGELSAAAIALRLAIALFLHEGAQSLLILDEVLVSMSEDRSQLILDVITSLTQAQIIFISHSPTINAFADKVVSI